LPDISLAETQVGSPTHDSRGFDSFFRHILKQSLAVMKHPLDDTSIEARVITHAWVLGDREKLRIGVHIYVCIYTYICIYNYVYFDVDIEVVRSRFGLRSRCSATTTALGATIGNTSIAFARRAVAVRSGCPSSRHSTPPQKSLIRLCVVILRGSIAMIALLSPCPTE